MKKYFYNFNLLLLLSLFFVSCGEDTEESILFGCTNQSAVNFNPLAQEEDNSCMYDLATILPTNQWYISSVTADLGLEEPIDLLALLPDLLPECTHDNIFTFFIDGSVEMDDNILVCEENEVSLIDLSGSWSISGSQLNIVNGLDQYELEVQVISSNEMELIFPYSFSETLIVPAKISLVTI